MRVLGSVVARPSAAVAEGEKRRKPDKATAARRQQGKSDERALNHAAQNPRLQDDGHDGHPALLLENTSGELRGVGDENGEHRLRFALQSLEQLRTEKKADLVGKGAALRNWWVWRLSLCNGERRRWVGKQAAAHSASRWARGTVAAVGWKRGGDDALAW